MVDIARNKLAADMERAFQSEKGSREKKWMAVAGSIKDHDDKRRLSLHNTIINALDSHGDLSLFEILGVLAAIMDQVHGEARARKDASEKGKQQGEGG